MHRITRRLLEIVFILVFSAAGLRAAAFDVRDYGATGDGTTLDTRAIQAAVDAAATAGGGTVLLPSGRYLSGTIFLKSRVEIHLEHGSVLLGSTNLDDYPDNVASFRSYTDNYVRHALIWGEGVSDVAITGSGVIDGQGGHENWDKDEYIGRPYMIRLVSSSHVRIEGITLLNSPMWVQHYLNCDYVTLRGLTVISQVNRNNDMVDIDGCRNVIVSDCFGDTEDDAVTLKSTAGVPTENVTITNCVLRTQCNAVKFGTESSGGFRNITASNITVNSDYTTGPPGYKNRRIHGLSAVSLELVDGGMFENVTVSNITASHVMVPLFIRLGNRARPYREGMPPRPMGAMRNIVVSGVVATDVDRFGCSITGLPGHPVRGVTLRDFRLEFSGGGTRQDVEREVPENEAEYPEGTMFGVLPAWGIYCRHVEGIRMEGIDLAVTGEDARPALVFDDVAGLDIDGLSERKPEGNGPAVLMRGVSRSLVRGCIPDRHSRAFIRLERGTEQVSAVSNDLSALSGEIFEFGAGVPRSVLFENANRLK